MSSKEILEEKEAEGVWATPSGAHIPPRDPRSKYKYNVFCRLTFSWVDPLFCIALKRSLNHSDLYAHPSEGDSHYLLSKFNRYWSHELQRRKRGLSVRLLLVWFKCFWWRAMLQGFLQLIEVGIFVGLADVLGYLSDYFVVESPTQTETRNAYLYAMGIGLLSFLLVLFHAFAFHYSHYLGMLSRILFSSAIYQKILRLSHTTVNNLTVGHIVNLASNDIHRFDQAFLFYHFFWISPLHLAVFTYLVYTQVQWVAFLATALVLLQIPSQMILMRLFTKLRLKAAIHTDKRVKVMNEVISGIRVIKMYAWEYAFRDLVSSIRKSEVWIVMKSSVIRAVNLSYFTIALPIIMFVIFTVYVSTGGTLSPRRVFTTLSLIAFVRLSSIHFFVLATLQLSEARVAWKRIKNLLLLGELSTVIQSTEEPGTHNTELSSKPKDSIGMSNGNVISLEPLPHKTSSGDIIVDDVTASWSMDADKPTLKNISFTLDKTNLMAVIGTVGSGKSTLLQCLLKELPCLEGRIEVNGSIGYASQEPWIFSASMRENILFGLPYQSVWYDTVIEACALDKDIDNLPHGDLTLVGERGVTLSGGQKARVSLARAIYRKADIYLLDDPLSAVDAAVSRHIFNRCIRDLLSDKCVVLVTHQLQYLQQCDVVLGLKEGCVTVYGDPSEVLADGDVFDLIGETENEADERKMFTVRKNSLIGTQSGNEQDQIFQRTLSAIEEGEEFDEEEGIDPLLLPPPFLDATSYHSVATYQQKDVEDVKDKEKSVALVATPAEERAHGRISLKTYYKFFRAGGNILFIFFVFFVFIFGECTVVLSDWWISDWADCDSAVDTNRSICSLNDKQRIGIYGGLVGSVIFTCICRYLLFFILALRAARILHNRMFECVLRAPVLFFDTNPIGRVLNRFSKDIGFLDDLLPYITCEYIFLLTRSVAIVLVTIVANPYILIALFFLLIGFLFIRWYYLKTARDIKRLEALARSPLYSHISITLQGLSTIRSYSMQSEALKQFHNFHNQHTQAWYLYIVTVRWFGMRIDVVSALFVTVVALSVVPLAGTLNAGVVGLALTYAVSLNGMFQYCVRQSAEVENLMVSAERVMAYGKLESEASLETVPPSSKPPSDWPSEGHLELNDLSYRHSPEGPLVLKGITCTVKSGEKIGIVGRTGAGKSSLVESLFRLAEPRGSIKIDEVDVCNVGLHDVRSKISIIPQDPVLFGGSVRYNLDPFGYYDDDKIWKALDHVQLKSVVQALDGQLEAEVSEGGGNFSVGQRQLFCLARALLKNNKILIMDEATANVDLETDSIIQEVIRDQFSHCTVLTIAHRLDTVMDADKIMVFRTGELCEYDEPHELLARHGSYLERLVEHTGSAAAEKLKAMALAAHNERVSPEDPKSDDITLYVTQI